MVLGFEINMFSIHKWRYYELGPEDPPYAAKFYDCCGAEDPNALGCVTSAHISYDDWFITDLSQALFFLSLNKLTYHSFLNLVGYHLWSCNTAIWWIVVLKLPFVFVNRSVWLFWCEKSFLSNSFTLNWKWI